MNYSNLNLIINTDYDIISILPGHEIQVKKYVSIEEKNDIIALALQESEENGIFNLYKLKMLFSLFIVYTYTDIVFTEEEKDDPVVLYDTLQSNGILNSIIEAINKVEYNELVFMLEKTMQHRLEYRKTLASVLNSFVDNLPTNANAAKNIIEQFDPAAFQRVLDFAAAANGNRPIE